MSIGTSVSRSARSYCCTFGGISSESSTMSYSSLTKPSLRNVTNNNWCNWAEHWSLNAPNIPKDMTKWSFSTTTLGHTLLKSSRKLWKHLTRMSYPTRHIRQTLLFRTTTCSGRWLMAWLSSTLLLMKKPKYGSILGSPQTTRNFLNAVSVYYLKDGQR